MSNLIIDISLSYRNPVVIHTTPGQSVSIVFDIVDGYGQRADGYQNPVITSIINPSLASASGYPQTMTKISTGLYLSKFTLPNSASAIGSYIVNITYYDPDDSTAKNTYYLVVVGVGGASGQFSISTV